MKQDQDVKNEIFKIIEEVDWKLEALLSSYFIQYFEKEFLPNLKKLTKMLK